MTNRSGLSPDVQHSTHTTPAVSGALPVATVTRTPNYHYALARHAGAAARSLSDEIAGHNALSRMTGIAWGKDDDAKHARDNFYLLAAAHRQAAHRMERGQRIRYRFSVLIFPATRIANKIRRLRNERRAVNV